MYNSSFYYNFFKKFKCDYQDYIADDYRGDKIYADAIKIDCNKKQKIVTTFITGNIHQADIANIYYTLHPIKIGSKIDGHTINKIYKKNGYYMGWV